LHFWWPHKQELLQKCVVVVLAHFSVLNIKIQGPATKSQANLFATPIQEVSLSIGVICCVMTKLSFITVSRLYAEILLHHLPVMCLIDPSLCKSRIHNLLVYYLLTLFIPWNGGNHNLLFALIPPFKVTSVEGDLNFNQPTVIILKKTAEVVLPLDLSSVSFHVIIYPL
jgi:hypothetical protein